MQKKIFLLLLSSFILSCSGVKKAQESLHTGNYQHAITQALQHLKRDKTKEKNQPYIGILQQAYQKANTRDTERISFLEQDANPANLEAIYNLYLDLQARQDRIRPILPLYDNATGKETFFKLTDYSTAIINAKNNLSEYLYQSATADFNKKEKLEYRKIYEDLQYLQKINPNYKDTRNYIKKAQEKGTDFISVVLYNETDKVIAKDLQDDLLNFDTYGLNSLWRVYHNNVQPMLRYDYTIELVLKDIVISPERVKETQIIKEKQIKDGTKYLKDAKGKTIKDSLGNRIKVDNFKKIRCELQEFKQQKTAAVLAKVFYVNNATRQNTATFPIESEYIFEHIYASYSGDKRALEKTYIDLLRYKEVPFPSDEQMIYDAAEDVKQKFKAIITQHKFHN